MDDRHEHRGLRGRAFRITERLHWVHAGLGMAGNVLFLVGSVLFLWDATQLLGTWLFILASLGLLLGSVGDKLLLGSVSEKVADLEADA
jgi:hypothetical protein